MWPSPVQSGGRAPPGDLRWGQAGEGEAMAGLILTLCAGWVGMTLFFASLSRYAGREGRTVQKRILRLAAVVAAIGPPAVIGLWWLDWNEWYRTGCISHPNYERITNGMTADEV